MFLPILYCYFTVESALTTHKSVVLGAFHCRDRGTHANMVLCYLTGRLLRVYLQNESIIQVALSKML